jgi:hypothetical protein
MCGFVHIVMSYIVVCLCLTIMSPISDYYSMRCGMRDGYGFYIYHNGDIYDGKKLPLPINSKLSISIIDF